MFLVIYEKSLTPRKFGVEPTIYDNWEDADARVKQTTIDRKVRAWVGELTDPPLLEIPKSAEVVKFGK